MIPTFDKEKFCSMIEQMVLDYNISYMDAIVSLCEIHDIDIELMPSILNRRIIDYIEGEAVELKMIKHGATLPI